MTKSTTDSRARETADVEQRDVAFARSAPRYGRLASWIVVLVIAANFSWLVATNPNFGWPVVAVVHGRVDPERPVRDAGADGRRDGARYVGSACCSPWRGCRTTGC